MRKIRIPMASLEESHNVKRVEEDRTIAIEAAIVRIMKVSTSTSTSALLWRLFVVLFSTRVTVNQTHDIIF